MEVDTQPTTIDNLVGSIDQESTPIKVETLSDFDLSDGVLLLLKRIGLVPCSVDEVHVPTSTSVLSNKTHTQTGWLPLLPTADAAFLLSTLPPCLRPKTPFTIATAPATSATRRHLIDTLARLALEPSLTMEIMMRFRPLSPVLWGKWLEMLGLDGEGAWREGEEREGERAAVDKVLSAMVRVLAVFENVFP